jgi:L,D-transpeptidase ErfK/SrfK
MYGIHGTDIPWGVGMQVSHGCVRLYPEDIERLFPMIPVGTPGEFAYEPVKVGRRGNAVYVEVHEDIYGYTPRLFSDAMAALQRRRRVDGGDQNQRADALQDGGGMPFRVSPDPEGAKLALITGTPHDRTVHPDDEEPGDD